MARAPAELYQPSPRGGHASVSIGGKVVQWGGYDKDKLIPASTVEMFDGSWESIETVGTPPTAVIYSASTSIGSTAYNFGGLDGNSRSNALHSLTAGEWRWRELRALNPEQGPRPKRGSGMVTHREDVLVVVGGETDDGLTNEIHCFCVGGGECS